MSGLPVVLLPVGVGDDALDGCLAALDGSLPARARVWLADDAQAGPRALAIIERWLARTELQADYTRRERRVGEVAHLDEMLMACGDADVIVLAPDAIPAPGWAMQLSACFSRDAAIATATTWCNAGEAVAWPRIGEINDMPADLGALARACPQMAPRHPGLASGGAHPGGLRLPGRGRAPRARGGIRSCGRRSPTR